MNTCGSFFDIFETKRETKNISNILQKYVGKTKKKIKEHNVNYETEKSMITFGKKKGFCAEKGFSRQTIHLTHCHQ